MNPTAFTQFRTSLAVRIIVGVLLLLALTTALQIALSNRLVHQSVLAELQARLEAKADYNIKELRYNLDRLRRDVILLSHLPSLQGIARASINNGIDPKEQKDANFLKQRLQDVLSAFAKANPDYYQLRVVGLADGGRELIRVESNKGQITVIEPEHLQQKGSRDYFNATLALKDSQTYLSDINLNQEFGTIEVPHRKTIRCTTPVFAPNGQMFAMVVINMDLAPTMEKLVSTNLDYMLTYMFNHKGEYLLHPDPAKTFGFEFNKTFRWQDDVKLLENPAEGALLGLSLNTLQFFTLAGERQYGVQQNFNFDDWAGKSRYVALVYAVPAQYLEARNQGLDRIVLFSALGAALAISILLYFYVRRLVAPLVAMGAAAQLIGEGDYSVQMPKTHLQEVKQLLESFTLMKEKIAARDSEIIETNQRLKSSLDYADLIIESMPEAIIIANASGEILRANSQLFTLFGYEPEELLGQPIEILVPKKFHSVHLAHRTGYMAEQVSRPMGAGKDLYGLRKNGSEVPVEIGLNIVHSYSGTNILATIIDITHRKKNEAKLLHSNTRYRLAASAAGLGFWDYDLVTGMLSWDENMYRIYGFEQPITEEQPYTLWANAVHPDDLPTSEQALQMAIRGEAPFDTEFRVIHPSGEIHVIKAQAFVLRDDRGMAVKVYGVNLDITARKKAEKQQQKLVRDLSLINAELNSFTYVASHDLKSPLRGVDQLAGWILEDLADNLSPVTRKHLELMQNRIHRMEKLLDDLLEYSRAGRSNADNVQVDTELMVRDILDFIGPSKQVNLIFQSPMPVLVTKKVPLDAVFRNLINNAIKHHPAEHVDIYLSCRQLGEFYEFAVGDNGAGIAPEHQGKIFHMFQTLKSRDLVEGSGIGLALVKKLVEGLGGCIRVESDGCSGTWFYFTWPSVPNDVY